MPRAPPPVRVAALAWAVPAAPTEPWMLLANSRVALFVEYSLYDDVMASGDLRFFDRVDQLALETHLSSVWAVSDAQFLMYGRLLALLIRSGLKLQHPQLQFCSGGEEHGSVVPLARSSGYLLRARFHCEDLLFAREGSSFRSRRGEQEGGGSRRRARHLLH